LAVESLKDTQEFCRPILNSVRLSPVYALALEFTRMKPVHPMIYLRTATFLLLACGSSAVFAQSDLKIATLNCEFLVRERVHVKFGLPFDPKEWTGQQIEQWSQPGYRDARFNECAKAIAEVVKRMNADILGLVEVGSQADVDELRREVRDLGLDYAHMAVGDSTDTMTHQHVALFSKLPFRDVLPQIPGRAFYDRELDEPESEAETGLSKGMRVVLDANGKALNLYLVHLSSERGGHEKDAQRVAQATIVRRHYLPVLRHGQHVVVLGDLNDHRGQPAMRRIRGRDDIWDDLVQTAGPAFHRFRRDETVEQYNRRVGDHWSYEYSGRRLQLDHILISRSVLESCGHSGIDTQFVMVDEKVPSTGLPATDHRGLIVTLDFNSN